MLSQYEKERWSALFFILRLYFASEIYVFLPKN